jgi:hypothetical protein
VPFAAAESARRVSLLGVSASNETACRICGLDSYDGLWDSTGAPSHLICDCCGGEAGVDDINVRAVRRYRASWLSRATDWSEPKAKPSDWDPKLQSRNVPQKYR